MEKAVSAAEANRQFSQILRQVREGNSYIVTSHGKPVARIMPVRADSGTAEARRHLLDRLARQTVIDIGGWSREELYDR